ncbi:MAG: aminodeoxychorismate/anthranilate synthase component II [Sphingomonadales bacterium]|nr:aminodeoxychorismate/anthranilate synthase component II [Sphingomonadales bacterium]
MRVLLIDFYDSFTYNLAHYLESFGIELVVLRHDTLANCTLQHFDAFILSPGPGLPQEKEGLFAFLEQYVGQKPILGVCLGMQALAEFLGATLENQQHVKHGVSEEIEIIRQNGLFSSLPKSIEVGLYHSWKVNCPEPWVSAKSKSGVNMAIEIPEKKVYGVQFHPESVMTPHGKEILKNFIQIARHD